MDACESLENIFPTHQTGHLEYLDDPKEVSDKARL